MCRVQATLHNPGAPFDSTDSVKAFISTPPSPEAKGEEVDLGEEPERYYLRECWEEFTAMEGEQVESVVKAFTRRVEKEGKEAFSGMGGELQDGEKGNLVEGV